MEKEIEFKISYDGGSASDGLLDIYDAGVSIYGLSRSLAITTHAFINKGEIRRRAERVRGAKIFLSPPRQGSFEEIVKVVLSNDATSAIGYSIAAAAFWDFLKWTWSETVGKIFEPETPYVKRIAKNRELFLGEFTTVLEASMASMHRPIESDNDITIDVIRPRVGSIITLDQETLQYVTTRSESDEIKDVLGNVTKYNLLSGFGRFFGDMEARTIPFDIDHEMGVDEKGLLTWSMHQRSQGNHGKLLLDVIRVLNAKNELKRYHVNAVRKAP
jgi:hypothetical protein